jgi:transcriptional regulator with XRE-family HTH domain
MPTHPSRPNPRARHFGQYLADAARAAGYDIDSPRSGGRSALAEAAGMTLSSVGRTLSGQSIPDVSRFEDLAAAVNRPVIELLIEAGIISAKSLTEPAQTRVASLTPDQAATELGITDPDGRALFLGMVARLRTTSTTTADDPDSDTGQEHSRAAHQ